MTDWADEKAREWWDSLTGPATRERIYSSLAALLREVKCDDDLTRAGVLAEVRRVVEEQKAHALDNARRLACWDGQADEARCRELAAGHCDEILSLLSNL